MSLSAESEPENIDGLVDLRRLARFLDVEPKTLSAWVTRQVPYLPPPIGEMSGPVWRLSDLEGVREKAAQRRPGRPRKPPAPE